MNTLGLSTAKAFFMVLLAEKRLRNNFWHSQKRKEEFALFLLPSKHFFPSKYASFWGCHFSLKYHHYMSCTLLNFSRNFIVISGFKSMTLHQHSVKITKINSHWQNITWNRLFSNFWNKYIAFTKFLSKMR